jgi:lysophospholipid acyltransferase (LPLAT)-like uncharacterized protein
MGKLFSTRELFYRYPKLGKLRHDLLAFFANHGTTWLERSFRRITIIEPQTRRLLDEGKPVILALYHEDMAVLMEVERPKRHKVTILVSSSRDGDMIAAAAQSFGFSVARGSSARGAVKGMLSILEAANRGQSIAMLVDGPKGPRQEIKMGTLKLAQMSGLPIVPAILSARSAWWTRSWDRYQAVSWGSPTVSVYAEPFYVDSSATDEELEAIRQRLSHRMSQLHKWVDEPWPMSDGKRVGGLIA